MVKDATIMQISERANKFFDTSRQLFDKAYENAAEKNPFNQFNNLSALVDVVKEELVSPKSVQDPVLFGFSGFSFPVSEASHDSFAPMGPNSGGARLR